MTLRSFRPSRFSTAFEYLGCAIGIVLIAFIYLHFQYFNINYAFGYGGDGLFSQAIVKTIIDTGWYTTNPYLGFQNGYNLNDYPMCDDFHMLLIWVLAHIFSHNSAIIDNLFYLLTYFTSAFSALFVLRFFGLRYPLALAASILFAFLPFHLARGESHFFLSSYYSVPIWTMIALSMLLNKPIQLAKSNFWDRFFKILILIIISSSGLYYTFFGCFFVFIAGIIRRINDNDKAVIKKMFQIIIISSLTIFFNLLPSIIYQHEHGSNYQIIQRSPAEAEFVGLTLTKMILPIEGHRITILANLREHYDNSLPPFLNNENRDSGHGFIGTFGLLILLGGLFCQEKLGRHPKLLAVAKLNLAGILLATIGGFAVLFALLITPEIRSYNRISPFIGLFSLYAFFYCIQAYLERKKATPKIYWLLAIILLNLGLLDQIGPGSANPTVPSAEAQMNNDQMFVGNIEKILPPGSAIFQLPYNEFPEGTPTNTTYGAYNLFRGYLNSTDLYWSFGAIKGRNIALWQQQTAALAPKTMVNQLVFAGYSGIYIDRNSYSDKGKAIENQFEQVLREKPLVSNDQTLSFFDLNAYKQELQKKKSARQWQFLLNQTQIEFNVGVAYSHCFPNQENRCTHSNNTIILYNNYIKPLPVTINFKTQGNTNKPNHLWIKWPGSSKTEYTITNQEWLAINQNIVLQPGINELNFKTDSEPTPVPGYARPSYFKLSQIGIHATE